MIYLDNSATTKPYPSVVESFQHVSEDLFANASSIHHLGGKSERLLNTARKQIGELLGVDTKEVIFTSGGTEGNNLAIKGIALQHQNRGKHIITTEIEHPSVYDTCKALEELGFEITYLPVNSAGQINVAELTSYIREDTILVSIMHVNNELGTIQDIEEVGNMLKRYPKVFFHVDHVQGVGKAPLNIHRSCIDLCTISGHKIHGLKGTGVLFLKEGTSIFPLLHGGNQENKIRSGTENLAGAVSLARALRMTKEKEKTDIDKLHQLHSYLRKSLVDMEYVYVNTPLDRVAPHIMNISIPGLKSEVLIHALDEQDIFISTKSACSSKVNDESRILKACGFDLDRNTSALRISLSYETTTKELDEFAQALKKAIKQLKIVME